VVITSNKNDELEKAKRLMDFLKPINPKDPEDMEILNSWVRHFQTVDAPFRVEQSGKYLRLLKIRNVEAKK
jgi:hypothetical protein